MKHNAFPGFYHCFLGGKKILPPLLLFILFEINEEIRHFIRMCELCSDMRMCLLDPGEGTNHHCQRIHQASPAQDHLVLHYYWHNTLLDKPGQDVMLI